MVIGRSAARATLYVLPFVGALRFAQFVGVPFRWVGELVHEQAALEAGSFSSRAFFKSGRGRRRQPLSTSAASGFGRRLDDFAGFGGFDGGDDLP